MRGYVTIQEYQRVCEEVGRLKAELDYLRGENADEAENTRRAALRRAFGLTEHAAIILLCLYGRDSRVVRTATIEELLPQRHGGRLETNTVNVRVCHIRRALGQDAIETVWGSGYRLTQAGRAAVERVLGQSEREAA